jgi:hypothetical protein
VSFTYGLGFSTLAAGTLVDLDLVIQPDASLKATRVEVNDLAAVATSIGPPISPTSKTGEFVILPVEAEGCTILCANTFQYDTSTVFGVSGQFTNVQSLPFTVSFASSTLVPGQNVSNFSSSASQGAQIATTATLLPQTLNGTVTSVSTANGFTVYTVSLAPYDLIPTLQQYVGPITRLNTPNIVNVYVDANTSLLNSSPIDLGNNFRFRGLIFDDNGTLRMDCSQINDGVPE